MGKMGKDDDAQKDRLKEFLGQQQGLIAKQCLTGCPQYKDNEASCLNNRMTVCEWRYREAYRFVRMKHVCVFLFLVSGICFLISRVNS
jgi:hypothetical protein